MRQRNILQEALGFLFLAAGALLMVLMLSQPLLSQQASAELGMSTASLESIRWGKEIYRATCSACHGMDGKGDGPVAANLQTKPRDFTSGTYEFRSTSSGQLPTDQDLFRTITSGIHATSMPSFKMLSPEDRAKVVSYIKTFSTRFSNPNEYPLKPVEVGTPAPFTRESAARGRKLYLTMQCFVCHGRTGRGDGPNARELKDAWGRPMRPRDLTKAHASKMATDSVEIYRTFTTGLDGTPMPSFAEALTSEERWDLANYVLSLQRKDEYYELQPGE